MEIFGSRLKQRAEQLGISNAEAARRCDLDERRYGHYVSGRREPDLATLMRIAHTLGTTPNWLLGLSPEGEAATPRSSSIDRLVSVARAIPERELSLLVALAETMARHTRETHGNPDAEDP
ncbi:helix-turn-helix domain-containing protein [Pseudochelatococcus lubricantis]|uniref:helix-turn-helix domain-containing protein n=1 Tax=Pseudochelatococcus lubricantis TaxID=1538102 RepID=UPI0035EBFDD5